MVMLALNKEPSKHQHCQIGSRLVWFPSQVPFRKKS